MTDDAFIKTLEQETARQAAMLNGDPGPMINYWADSDDITLFGGWEPFKNFRVGAGFTGPREKRKSRHKRVSLFVRLP